MRTILPILLPAVLAAPVGLRAQTAVPTPAETRAEVAPTPDSADQQDREENEARQELQKAATAPENKTPEQPKAPAADQPFRLDVPVLRLRRPEDTQMETAAWLGVSVTAPPSALIHQLRLPEGTALVVDFAQPGSPAAKAGLRKYDLLLKLNDQLLINAEQLAVLVRTFKPDEKIQITLMREGRRQTVQVTLVGREMPPLDQESVQPAMTPPAVWGAQPVPQGGVERVPDLDGQSRYFDRGPRSVPWVGSAVTWVDGKRTFLLNRVDDHRNLTVLSPEGKVEFQGNVDTPDQLKALRPDLRRSLERMDTMTAAHGDPLFDSGRTTGGGTVGTPQPPANPASR